MIHGIIDIGSNTIRMAVYKVGDNEIELLAKKKDMAGLGGYIEAGNLCEEGIDRACASISAYRAELETAATDQISVFATAALRNIDNSAAAVREILERTGVHVRILSGEEEASFAFKGAICKAQIEDGLLVDIGGASTELIACRLGELDCMASLPFGALTLRKEFVGGVGMPTRGEAAAMMRRVADEIAAVPEIAAQRYAKICGIGGTFKATRRLYAACFGEKGEPMRAGRIAALFDLLLEGSVCGEPTDTFLRRVVPDRAHMILPGMAAAVAIVGRFGDVPVLYSDAGVREGYLMECAARQAECNTCTQEAVI